MASNVAGRAGQVALDATSSAFGAVSSATTSAANAVGSKVLTYETSKVIWLMRVLNLINGAGLIAAGVLMLMAVPTCTGQCPAASMAIIAFYLVVFGALLFAYEARLGVRYQAFFRKYFGFMYGYWGRFFFILFLGSLTFGVFNTSVNFWPVTLIVGIYTFANALLNCFIIRQHPGFQSGEAQSLATGGIGDASPHGGGGGVDAGGGIGAPASSRSAYGMDSSNAAQANPFAVSHV